MLMQAQVASLHRQELVSPSHPRGQESLLPLLCLAVLSEAVFTKPGQDPRKARPRSILKTGA